jgi:hypothetical protein
MKQCALTGFTLVVPSEAKDIGVCPLQLHLWRTHEPGSLASLGVTNDANDDM